MQVKCKFQLTSETESSESINSNDEKIRLCASVDLDKNSTLIVMICCNETGNNHIVAYFIENRNTTISKKDIDTKTNSTSSNHTQSGPVATQQLKSANSLADGISIKTKPRVIVKQIFYHHHNEDISAICLSDSGSKLALISASSTIYILPIKNILLNLHAKQLSSSQRKSMYYYDASIIDSCHLDDPIAIAYWESEETESKSRIVVANKQGEICFLCVGEKKVLHKTRLNELISSMKIIKDQYNSSLLVACESTKQYRFALETVRQEQIQHEPQKFTMDRLILLELGETLTHVVQTNRFIAVATNRDRCLICSRNCYNLRNASPNFKLDPLLKEVAFNNEEKILQLLKSPVQNDQDNMIDSFLLITTRSIYSIEPRQSCREMYVNLIDSHLGIKQSFKGESITERFYRQEFNHNRELKSGRKNSESNPLINSFLNHCDQVYGRINHDSRAFSTLFKVELSSLFEAYGDRSLIRHQYELANRFYLLASIDHIKIVGKYIRMGAIDQIIDYITNVICSRLNESTDDSCRIWCNYVNFYLNYVGGVNDLNAEIFNLIDRGSLNCRAIISLFKAIKTSGSPMEKLFDTVFLMKILEKTLELVPQSTDIEALSDLFVVF